MPLPWQLEREQWAGIDPDELAQYIGKEIDLLYELPMSEEQVSAVYFMFFGPELYYVGSSANVRGRLGYHIRDQHYGGRNLGFFTHIGVLPVPEHIRFTIEAHYIQRFQPWANTAGR